MHTCFQYLIAKTFRVSSLASPSPKVADFLAPALKTTRRRAIARGASTTRCLHTTTARLKPICTHGETSQPLRARSVATSDSEAWLNQLNPLLLEVAPFLTPPKHTSSRDEGHSKAEKIAKLVIRAYETDRMNLVSYLSLHLGRWQETIWMVKEVLRTARSMPPQTEAYDPLKNISWPILSMDKATGFRIPPGFGGLNAKIKKAGLEIRSLDSLTGALSWEEGKEGEEIASKAFLGILWRSLGDMILAAAEPENAGNDQIMIAVLQILAELHHLDIIPEKVYRFDRKFHEKRENDGNDSNFVLQQPPLLHILSSNILTSLSDAAWASQQSEAHPAFEQSPAQRIFGIDIPGTRYKAMVQKVSMEIWLELVLWSCLHGGWVNEGVDTILKATASTRDKTWSLVCWSSLLQAGESLDKTEQQSLKRTISSEVVANFIDRLVDERRIDVRGHGMLTADTLQSVSMLGKALEMSGLGLGGLSWDSIILRFLEPVGIELSREPEILQALAGLAQPVGQELSLRNNTQSESSSYVFEPSAIALNVYHRALDLCTSSSTPDRAFEVFRRLLAYTDTNKRQSIAAFFASLRSVAIDGETRTENPFDSRHPPVKNSVGFSTKIPSTILGRLLDLATEARQFDFGRWLLYSEDPDGPLINQDGYFDLFLVPSIIRFGTATGDEDLLRAVFEAQTTLGKARKRKLPIPVLDALVQSQITSRRWRSVENLLEHIKTIGGSHQNATTIAVMVRELLRLESQSDTTIAAQELTELLREHIKGRFGTFDVNTGHSAKIILAIFATVDPKWAAFGRSLWKILRVRRLQTNIECFNIILEGTVETYGISKGQELIEIWCSKVDEVWPYTGTVSTSTWTKGYGGLSEQEVIHASRSPVDLTGYPVPVARILERFIPNMQTVRIMIRHCIRSQEHAFQDESFEQKRSTTLAWARIVLQKLGFPDDVIKAEMRNAAP